MAEAASDGLMAVDCPGGYARDEETRGGDVSTVGPGTEPHAASKAATATSAVHHRRGLGAAAWRDFFIETPLVV